MPHRVIHLQAAAPAKPAPGSPCNGCGVCCAAETCPLGRLLTRDGPGPCAALEWHAPDGRYRCGVLADPRRWLRWLPARAGRALAARWIAAGTGCDCDYSAGPPG